MYYFCSLHIARNFSDTIPSSPTGKFGRLTSSLRFSISILNASFVSRGANVGDGSMYITYGNVSLLLSISSALRIIDYNLNKASHLGHMWDPRFSTRWILGGNNTAWTKGNSFYFCEHVSPNFRYLRPANH
jgi:YHS domain-containing protein